MYINPEMTEFKFVYCWTEYDPRIVEQNTIYMINIDVMKKV